MGRPRVNLGWYGRAAHSGPLPDDQEGEEGYCSQGGRQQQAKAAPRALLRGFNWPEWEMG